MFPLKILLKIGRAPCRARLTYPQKPYCMCLCTSLCMYIYVRGGRENSHVVVCLCLSVSLSLSFCLRTFVDCVLKVVIVLVLVCLQLDTIFATCFFVNLFFGLGLAFGLVWLSKCFCSHACVYVCVCLHVSLYVCVCVHLCSYISVCAVMFVPLLVFLFVRAP